MEKPLEIVLSECYDMLHSLDQRHNTSKGTYTFQIMKVFGTKYVEIDQIAADIANTRSVQNSTGFELDYHGIEAGQWRKPSSRATCTVKCTGQAADFLVPASSRFSTRTGINYLTTIDAILPNIIAMTKGPSGEVDAVPSPYSDVGSVLWINSTPSRTGTEYDMDTDWEFVDDEVTWVGEYPAENSIYYMCLDDTDYVSVTIPVIAEIAGKMYNVSEKMLVVNSNGLAGVNDVTNDDISTGGEDVESHSSFRSRLIKTSRTQYGLDSIAAMIAGLPFVRACNVTQDTGVDIAFPDDDWSDDGTWTTFEDYKLYGSDDVPIGQTFVPSGDVISIAQLSLHVKRVGIPPSFTLTLYMWVTDYSTTVSVTPLCRSNFNAEDVDPDNPDDWHEVKIRCRHGGFDRTKTYLFVIESSDDTADISNHWEFKYQAVGNEYSDGAMYIDGVEETNADVAFKTNWGGASFTAVVAMKQGYSFDDHVESIENDITDFNKRSYSPICIQGNIVECSTAEINIVADVFTDKFVDWDAVIASIRYNINIYLNSLWPGDNVYFSTIENMITSSPGVLKIRNCTIQKNDETPITKSEENDILVAKNEVAILGSPGTTFTRGVL